MSSLEDQIKRIEALEELLNDIKKTVVSADGNYEPLMGLLETMLLNVARDNTTLHHAQEVQQTLENREEDIRAREVAWEDKLAKLRELEVKLERGKARNEARETAIDARETSITAREHTLASRERNVDTQVSNQLSTGLEKLHQATQRLEGLLPNPATAEIAKKSDEMLRKPSVPKLPRLNSNLSGDFLELIEPLQPVRVPRFQRRPDSDSTLPSKRRYHALSSDSSPEKATESKRVAERNQSPQWIHEVAAGFLSKDFSKALPLASHSQGQ